MYTFYIRVIRAESLKLKRSPVWLAFFTLPLISAFFGTMNYKLNISVLQSEWYSLWSQHTLFLCYLFMPALIGTYCSYLWRLEHTRHNWNSFLTAPVPISILYLGKLTQAVRVTILGNLWIFLLYYVCGKFARISKFFSPGSSVVVSLRNAWLGGCLLCAASPLPADPFLRHPNRHCPCRKHIRSVYDEPELWHELPILTLLYGDAGQQSLYGNPHIDSIGQFHRLYPAFCCALHFLSAKA